MSRSEYDANQQLRATPKWTERPAPKPGIRLSTAMRGMFILALVAAIVTEGWPWLSAVIAGV